MPLHMLWHPEEDLNIGLILHPLVAVAVKAQPRGNLDLQPCVVLPRVLPRLIKPCEALAGCCCLCHGTVDVGHRASKVLAESLACGSTCPGIYLQLQPLICLLHCPHLLCTVCRCCIVPTLFFRPFAPHPGDTSHPLIQNGAPAGLGSRRLYMESMTSALVRPVVAADARSSLSTYSRGCPYLQSELCEVTLAPDRHWLRSVKRSACRRQTSSSRSVASLPWCRIQAANLGSAASAMSANSLRWQLAL